MKYKPLIRPAVIVLFFVEIFLSSLADRKNLYLHAEPGRSDISQNVEEDIGIFRVEESTTAISARYCKSCDSTTAGSQID